MGCYGIHVVEHLSPAWAAPRDHEQVQKGREGALARLLLVLSILVLVSLTCCACDATRRLVMGWTSYHGSPRGETLMGPPRRRRETLAADQRGAARLGFARGQTLRVIFVHVVVGTVAAMPTTS